MVNNIAIVKNKAINFSLMELPLTLKLFIGGVIFLVVFLIVKFIFFGIVGSTGQLIENFKIRNEISVINEYLIQNGWTIKYETSEDFNFLKHPLIFYKNYSKGVITVVQRKSERDLSVFYLNSKNLMDEKKIILHEDTVRNIERLFELEKKINYKTFRRKIFKAQSS